MVFTCHLYHVRECGNALSAALLNNERVDTMYAARIFEGCNVDIYHYAQTLEEILDFIYDLNKNYKAVYHVEIKAEVTNE